MIGYRKANNVSKNKPVLSHEFNTCYRGNSIYRMVVGSMEENAADRLTGL